MPSGKVTITDVLYVQENYKYILIVISSHKIHNSIHPLQERCASEDMTYTPLLRALSSTGVIGTGMNTVNPRSWLITSHFFLGFFFWIRHLWDASRSRAAGFEKVLTVKMGQFYQ